ncbi:hypothetical protein BEK67_21015 [Ralstonia pickettii]|nr:hypothetical protein BEK67_21015 [Ralstonia pickettii]
MAREGKQSIMPIHSPGSFLLQEFCTPSGDAALRLECSSITIASGGITVDQVEVRRLLSLEWVPHYLSFEADGKAFNFEVNGVVVIRPSRAVFPFA